MMPSVVSSISEKHTHGSKCGQNTAPGSIVNDWPVLDRNCLHTTYWSSISIVIAMSGSLDLETANNAAQCDQVATCKQEARKYRTVSSGVCPLLEIGCLLV